MSKFALRSSKMGDEPVTFKKRTIKLNNARRKEVGESVDHEEFDGESLQEIKLQQTSRSRKGGSSLEALTKSSINKVNTIDEQSYGESKTIESVIWI